MINKYIFQKTCQVFPSIAAQRFRVRNLPNERFENGESLFPEREKPKKDFMTDILAILHRKNFTFADYAHYRKWKEVDEMREDQMYLSERHHILGSNLATTHFICARGGKIKFKGNDKWMTQYEIDKGIIPNRYVPGYFVEEIDASGTQLCYEGFQNLSNLFELKKLTLQNCPFVDDWCLSRSHLFATSLQYLDISGCQNVTERGICALHPLRALKTLVLHNTPNIQNRELVSLLLQDVVPKLEVIGVDFQDPALLKRIEEYMD